MATLLATCLSLALQFTVSTAQSGLGTGPCLYPDGKTSDTNSTSCGLSGGALCCPPGTTCMSNGLCKEGDRIDVLIRGGCTDWNKRECSTACRSFNWGGVGAQALGNQTAINDAGVRVIKCATGNYCCQAESDTSTHCCDINEQPFVDANNLLEINGGATMTISATSMGSVAATATSASSSSTSTSASQTSATATSTESPTAAKTSSGLSKGAIAGIAVGAVALVAIIALVAFLLWRRKRKSYKAVHSPMEKQQLNRDTGMSPMEAGIGAGAAAGAGNIAAHQWHDRRAVNSHNDMAHHHHDHDHDDEAEAGMAEMKPPERITEHPVDSMDSVASASRQRDIQNAADRELEEEGIRPFSPEDLEHGRDSPATGLMDNRARDVSPER